MTRRSWLGALLPFGIGAATIGASEAASEPSRSDAVRLSEEQWRSRLSPAQYRVLRAEGTEAPGSSVLDREKRAGTYACAGCALALFSSTAKYDSGTGWPSFHTALPGAVATKTDYKLILPRTEYHCARCGGHQGHVFDDGPRPSGRRYCNNGIALSFVPEAA